MALTKYNYNSFNVTPVAGAALAFDADADGFSTVASTSMVLIKTLTASSSSTLALVNGSADVVLDSTYPVYRFVFINCLPANDGVKFLYSFSNDTGSSYDVTKTSTNFYAGHLENDSATGFGFDSGLAQSGDYAFGTVGAIGSAADEGCSGEMFLFNPSSTTFVKQFFGRVTICGSNPQSQITYTGGYCNTTAAIDAASFKFESGAIASGTIKMYGIKDS